MKKLTLAIAITAAGLSHQAFAQNKNFEGLSAGLSANFTTAKTEIPGQSPSDSSTTVDVKAAYGWALGGNFILSLGASYDLSRTKAGTTAAGTNFVSTDVMVISLEPGMKVSNNTLVYAKLGYATVNGRSEGASTGSENYSGTAIGVGARTMLAKSWSVDLEAQQLDFTAKRSATAGGNVKPSATTISVGVNYHF